MINNNDIQHAIDHLTQVSYNEQRRRFPHIHAEKWGLVYGRNEQTLLENNFQKTLTLTKK